MRKKLLYLLYIFCLLAFSNCDKKETDKNAIVASDMNPLSNQDPKVILSPDERYGELFDSVMVKKLFEDSKIFLDKVPTMSTDSLMALYKEEHKKQGFNWQSFVNQVFISPKTESPPYKTRPTDAIEDHITALWSVWTRAADSATLGSILPIPKPYIAASGQSRELTYGDSYFIMLGLQAAGRVDMIENMVENFAFLINTGGHIPSSNRTYGTSHSSPPFFACMVQLLADLKGKEVLGQYLPQLEKEYNYWMEGAENPAPKDLVTHLHVVQMDRNTLNRYNDRVEKPRPDFFQSDKIMAQTGIRPQSETYRYIRAAAESGWNFSSRWLEDGKSTNTINTGEIVPVDLNALMYNLELTISRAKIVLKKYDEATEWEKKASKRRDAMMRYCWAESKGMFFDFNAQKYKQTSVVSAAAAYPLYFNILYHSIGITFW